MKELYEWIRNIAFFLIFMSVITNLIPNKKYEKYLKLFSGMILVLLVLKPLTLGLGLDDKLAYYFEAFTLKAEAGDLKTKLLGMEDVRMDRMFDQYGQAIALDMAAMAEELGFSATAEVTMGRVEESEDFGRVTKVYLRLTASDGTKTTAEEGGVTPVEPVSVERVDLSEHQEDSKIREGGTEKNDSEKSSPEEKESWGDENQQIGILRRKIAEYYDLEENEIEIQLEDE